MKTIVAMIALALFVSACATQKPAPVVDHSVQADKPVVHSRTHCEPLGGPTSNKCR